MVVRLRPCIDIEYTSPPSSTPTPPSLPPAPLYRPSHPLPVSPLPYPAHAAAVNASFVRPCDKAPRTPIPPYPPRRLCMTMNTDCNPAPKPTPPRFTPAWVFLRLFSMVQGGIVQRGCRSGPVKRPQADVEHRENKDRASGRLRQRGEVITVMLPPLPPHTSDDGLAKPLTKGLIVRTTVAPHFMLVSRIF